MSAEFQRLMVEATVFHEQRKARMMKQIVAAIKDALRKGFIPSERELRAKVPRVLDNEPVLAYGEQIVEEFAKDGIRISFKRLDDEPEMLGVSIRPAS